MRRVWISRIAIGELVDALAEPAFSEICVTFRSNPWLITAQVIVSGYMHEIDFHFDTLSSVSPRKIIFMLSPK